MTKKKLSRQINLMDMKLKEVMRTFNNHPQVKGLLRRAIEVIDQSPSSVDVPEGVIGSVSLKTMADGSTFYRTTVSLGVIDGKRIRRVATGKTLKEAQEKAWQLWNNRANEIQSPERREHSLTLGEFLKEWLTSANRDKAVSTLRIYHHYVHNYIISPREGMHRIAHLRLHELTGQQLEKVYQGMIQSGLSNNTAHHCYRILGTAFKWGIRRGYLNQHPHNRIDPVRRVDTEAKALSVKEANRLIEESRDSKIGLFIQTAIYTGMRLSEIRGLKWNRVDFSTGSITVRSAVVSVSGRDVEKEPKTARSRRLIPLGAEHRVIQALASDKVIKEQKLAHIGLEVLPDHYIFSDNGEKPWSATQIGQHFKVACKKANVSLTIHEMRHTHMTIALMNGEPVDSVSRRGGHSKTSTTLNIYSHATAGDQTVAVNKFTEAMDGKKEPSEVPSQ